MKKRSINSLLKNNKLFLLGKDLSHSFSKAYFTDKFNEPIWKGWSYDNIELSDISNFTEIKDIPDLRGFNVTIPYKESIIPYLDELSVEAERVGAVNTIAVTLPGSKPYFKGYNTDKPAFEKTISPFLVDIRGAIVLGTGGASKAIAASLKDCNIPFIVVGRTSKVQYADLTRAMLETYNLIINCTPLGTFPAADVCPLIPYDCLNNKNILYDLVYNPAETLFMMEGDKKNAKVLNGLKMLEFQAEFALEIWKNP